MASTQVINSHEKMHAATRKKGALADPTLFPSTFFETVKF